MCLVVGWMTLAGQPSKACQCVTAPCLPGVTERTTQIACAPYKAAATAAWEGEVHELSQMVLLACPRC